MLPLVKPQDISETTNCRRCYAVQRSIASVKSDLTVGLTGCRLCQGSSNSQNQVWTCALAQGHISDLYPTRCRSTRYRLSYLPSRFTGPLYLRAELYQSLSDAVRRSCTHDLLVLLVRRRPAFSTHRVFCCAARLASVPIPTSPLNTRTPNSRGAMHIFPCQVVHLFGFRTLHLAWSCWIPSANEKFYARALPRLPCGSVGLIPSDYAPRLAMMPCPEVMPPICVAAHSRARFLSSECAL
ncbi:hypothetical protein BKA93DRAFT_166825 [Sparassis latifolia]